MKAAIRNVMLLAAGALLFLFTRCDDSPPPKTGTSQQQQTTAAQSESAPQAQEVKDVKSSWPPVAENEIEIAQNLTRKNFYVVFDCSGSMNEQQCYGDGNKMDVAKAALTNFAQLVPEDANLGMTIFINSTIEERVPLGTGNRNEFIAAVNSAYPSGETPLRSAMESGYRKLTDQATKQLGYGEYTLVVMTDGIASKGEDPTGIVYSILDRTPIEIHTIGFCIGENHSLNIPGRTVYKAANSQDDLQRGLEEVLAESETFDVSDFDSGR